MLFQQQTESPSSPEQKDQMCVINACEACTKAMVAWKRWDESSGLTFCMLLGKLQGDAD
jgi:hypothetical protein